MQVFRNIVFAIAVLALILWLGVPIVIAARGYHLKEKSWIDLYETSRIYVVPGAILLTLVKTLKRTDDAADEARKAGLTSLVSIIFLIGFAVARIGSPCDDIVKQTLFSSREHPNVKVVLRAYGCGATDTGPDILNIVQIENVSDKWERITYIDTSGLDHNLWIREP